MDHNYINELHILDRYLMGRLSADESAQFEEHFIDCPKCIEELKTTENFLGGLRPIAAERAAVVPGPDAVSRITNLNQELRKSQFAYRATRKFFAVAAAFMLAIIIFGAVFGIYEVRRLRQEVGEAKNTADQWRNQYQRESESNKASGQKHEETEQELKNRVGELEASLRSGSAGPAGVWLNPQVNLPIFPLRALRGGEQTQIPASTGEFVVQVNLEDKIFSRYRVTLLNDKGVAVFSSESLKRSPNNTITIGFNSKSLQSAHYTLKVEGGDKNTEFTVIGNYPFQMLKKQ